jgi:hypothetical protein
MEKDGVPKKRALARGGEGRLTCRPYEKDKNAALHSFAHDVMRMH